MLTLPSTPILTPIHQANKVHYQTVHMHYTGSVVPVIVTENNLVRQSQTQTHVHQGAEGSLQLYPHGHTHTTVLTRHLTDALINTDSRVVTHVRTRTHHGVEGLLQLLLLHEQTAGHALPLAVAASGGEETRQQHHQVPQRDLHRSAQPDRAREELEPSRHEGPRQGSAAGESGR